MWDKLKYWCFIMNLLCLRSDFIPWLHTSHDISYANWVEKFSVDTLEYFVRILVVSARLVSPFLLNLTSGSWVYSLAPFYPGSHTKGDWSNSCQDLMFYFFSIGAAMLIESLLPPPLSSSVSDCHQPSATANEPTSECSCTSTL